MGWRNSAKICLEALGSAELLLSIVTGDRLLEDVLGLRAGHEISAADAVVCPVNFRPNNILTPL